MSIAAENPRATQLIETIVFEIDDLVAQAEFYPALIKLRAFASDLAPELKFETTHLLSRLNVYDDEKRTGRTTTENINDLSHAILRLLKRVADSASGQIPPFHDNVITSVGTDQATVRSVDSDQLRRSIIRDTQWKQKDSEIVTAKGIEKIFDNANFTLGPISFSLFPGEIAVVIGRNGGGKSTLLNIVAGRSLQTKGSLFFPYLTQTHDWTIIRSHVRYISPKFSWSSHNIRHTLEFIAATCGKIGTNNKRSVDDYLARYDLERYAYRAWNELSDGYRMRFELVRALITSPKLLVLDEPLAHLDIVARAAFLSELSELTKVIRDPLSIVLSTHHLDEADLIADKMIVLERGRMKFAGSKAEMRDLYKGSIFHVIGEISRSSIVRDGIRGLQHVQSILGGVSLHFNEFIEISELIERIGNLKTLSVTSITDVSTSPRHLLMDGA